MRLHTLALFLITSTGTGWHLLFSRELIRPVETLPALLQAIASSQDLRRPALTYYEGVERISSRNYADYLADIDAWAEYLQREGGVKPGDRVATLLHNRAEVPVIYLAAMCVGAVVVPLNPGYSPAEMDFVIGDSAP